MTLRVAPSKHLFWSSWRAQGDWGHPTAYLTGQVGDDCNWCQMVRAGSVAEVKAWLRRQPGFVEERFCEPRDRIESTDRFQCMRAIRVSASGAILSLPRRLRRARKVIIRSSVTGPAL